MLSAFLNHFKTFFCCCIQTREDGTQTGDQEQINLDILTNRPTSPPVAPPSPISTTEPPVAAPSPPHTTEPPEVAPSPPHTTEPPEVAPSPPHTTTTTPSPTVPSLLTSPPPPPPTPTLPPVTTSDVATNVAGNVNPLEARQARLVPILGGRFFMDPVSDIEYYNL